MMNNILIVFNGFMVGISIGISFLFYGLRKDAERKLNSLRDKDGDFLRRNAMGRIESVKEKDLLK